jgi:hypothetical protein
LDAANGNFSLVWQQNLVNSKNLVNSDSHLFQSRTIFNYLFFHHIANSNKTIRYKFLENKWTLFHISATVCVIFREINWKLANLSLQIETDLHFFKTVKERWHFLFFEFITAVQSFSIKSNISNIFILIVPNLYFKIKCST